MQISRVGILSIAAALSIFLGASAAESKSNCSTTHCSKSGKHCCKKSRCCKSKSNSACAVLMKKGNCTTELEMMKSGQMCATMNGKGPITVFCPTDQAYAKLGKEKVEALKKDPKSLASYHVVGKKVMAADIKAGGSLPTKQGEHLMTNTKDGKAQVDGCLIIEEDIPCANGIIHIIDEVPIPERGK